LTLRPEIDRGRLPETGPVRRFNLPAIHKTTLPSGLRVWTVARPRMPIVAFLLLVTHGAADDPHGKEGLAALTADMLDEGSGGRSAIEMHEALARIGAQFDTELGSDATVVSLTTLSRFAEHGLTLLADIVVRPSLTAEDFARVRQLRLHRLTQLRDLPGAVAERTFVRLLYGDQPYGHTPMGNAAALASMTVGDVHAFHAQAFQPAGATLIAVGDCEPADVERLAVNAFGGWGEKQPPGAAAVRIEPSVPDALPARLNIVPRAGAPQSELRIGHVAASRATPDYHALVAANMVLGGQFVSRINLNLRQDKGLTYGARTSFDFRRRPGPFALAVSVQTLGTAQAIEESFAEITAIRASRPVTEEELALGVAALTRGFARGFETVEQIARGLAQLALYDLPPDYFEQFVPRMEQVTPSDVTRVMNEHVNPSRLTTLVVGDLDAIAPSLPALGLGDPVVLPADTF
jgi:zinc protease